MNNIKYCRIFSEKNWNMQQIPSSGPLAKSIVWKRSEWIGSRKWINTDSSSQAQYKVGRCNRSIYNKLNQFFFFKKSKKSNPII